MSKKVLHGNCLNVLRTLPDESIHCCITSPPYWGLRDYGTAKWEGGSEDCDHQKSGANKVFDNPEFNKNRPSREMTNTVGYRNICEKCGAIRVDDQIGIEGSPDEYVDRMVDVFREVRRVLRTDGTCWLNLGDSYNGNKKGNTEIHKNPKLAANSHHHKKLWKTLKPKDLVGIPWRVAFALQSDGWWLRQDIIWSKVNPFPESVTDRCTKSHEYIFLLTKSPQYWFDHEAIKEETDKIGGKPRIFGAKEQEGTMRHDIGRDFVDTGSRNKRSVWHLPTQPYPDAHFAVFPEKLISPCVLAGSPARCCAVCGKGWKRVVVKDRQPTRPGNNSKITGNTMVDGHRDLLRHCTVSSTVGFEPDCECGNSDYKPGVVMDPFSGSGTTGVVSITHGRDYIGIELNPQYIKMSEQRMNCVTPKTLFL